MSALLRRYPYTSLLAFAIAFTGIGCAFVRPISDAIFWGAGVIAGGGWIAQWTKDADED